MIDKIAIIFVQFLNGQDHSKPNLASLWPILFNQNFFFIYIEWYWLIAILKSSDFEWSGL